MVKESSTNLFAEDLLASVESDFIKDFFRNKTVLITGAAGFLGSFMVESLLFLNENFNTQIKILGLVRNLAAAKIKFSAHGERMDLILFAHDLNLPLQMDGQLNCIIHAASQASPKYYATDPLGTIMPNVFGTQHLLHLALRHQSENFLFVSSGEVYGVMPPEKIPIRETSFGELDPMLVRSCYGESKRMGENLCQVWFRQHGVPTAVVRPFHTYGPGLKPDDGRVFSDFIFNVVRGENIKLFSDGSAIRPYCYVSDAVRGFFTVLAKGRAGEVYNVGNAEEELSVRDLADMLVRLYPEKNLKVEFLERPAEKSNYLVSPIPRNSPSVEKLAALGWRAVVSAKQGFKRTIDMEMSKGHTQ